MAKKVISQRKRLAAIFASFAVLIMGTASLLESMSLDYYSVLNTVEKVIPASIALGLLGWFMGMVLDKPRKKSKVGYNNIFINEMMKTSTTETNEAEANTSETENANLQ